MSVAQELMDDEKGQQFLKEEIEKTRKYQRYQLQWMLDHEYSIDNLIRGLAQMQAEEMRYGDNKPIPIDTLYYRWVKDVGFGSEIWACREEWETTENGKETA